MISFLTTALERCSQVDLAVTELHLSELRKYRSAAFKLMRALSAEDLFEEFTDDRMFVGRHVSGTLRLPEDWNDNWLDQLAGGEDLDQFITRLRRDTDEKIGELAFAFVSAARNLRTAVAELNPLRASCRDFLDQLAGRTFLVLLQRPYPRCRQLYMNLDPRFTDSSLCRETDLRTLNRFVDVLLTTGRFDRFTPDHILTAPRWASIANIRWSGDADDRDDFPLFPRLTVRNDALPTEDTVPEANHLPVNIKRTVRMVSHVSTTANKNEADREPEGEAEWDAIAFDEWFLGKRQRLRGHVQKQIERPAAYSGAAIYVGIADGGGLFTPINEVGVARSLLAFDPFENVVAMRRPALDPAAEGDRKDYLEEGMMLLLPDEAVEDHGPTGTGRRGQNASERLALKLRWKRQLAELIRRRGLARVADQLSSIGVSLGNLAACVQRWGRVNGDEINAPRTEEHFRALVCDLLQMRDPDSAQEEQYPWWERAWDAVLYERSLNISLGLLEENERERIVKSAVFDHLDLVIDAARRTAGVTIPVGNGEGKVRIATVEFIDRGCDGRRFLVPEDECLTYLESHDARLRWLK